MTTPVIFHIQVAGTNHPLSGNKATIIYKIANLPEVKVSGNVTQGFKIEGFQIPTGCAIKAQILGGDLRAIISGLPEPDQARAVRNLIAYIEEVRPITLEKYSSKQAVKYRGIEETLQFLDSAKYPELTIGLAISVSRPAGSESRVDLFVGLEFKAKTEAEAKEGAGYMGSFLNLKDNGWMINAMKVITMPESALMAILQFQGKTA